MTTVRQLGDGDADRLTRLIVSQLDGLRVADALEVVHGAALALIRGRAEDAALAAAAPRQFAERLATAEAAEYLAARLGPFAPTLETLKTWSRPSRRRAYSHLDLPAPMERVAGRRRRWWRRRDLDEWIGRRLAGKAPDAAKSALSLNGDYPGDEGPIDERQLAAREAALEQRLRAQVEYLLNAAIREGAVPESGRELLVRGAEEHAAGAAAGLEGLADYLAAALDAAITTANRPGNDAGALVIGAGRRAEDAGVLRLGTDCRGNGVVLGARGMS